MGNRGTKFFYGWAIVAVGTLALVVSNGLSIGGIPVFYKSIREDFVSAGSVASNSAESFIAFGATLTFFFSGVLSPIAGSLIQRFRLRNLMLVGCGLLGFSEAPKIVGKICRTVQKPGNGYFQKVFYGKRLEANCEDKHLRRDASLFGFCFKADEHYLQRCVT